MRLAVASLRIDGSFSPGSRVFAAIAARSAATTCSCSGVPADNLRWRSICIGHCHGTERPTIPCLWLVRRAPSNHLVAMTLQLTASHADNRRLAGMIHGAIGMAIFAGSLPATRLAVQGLDASFLTAGRAAGAGILAALLLAATRQKLPPRADVMPLLVVAGGVVLG